MIQIFRANGRFAAFAAAVAFCAFAAAQGAHAQVGLPSAVAETHADILEAARSGDIERLRPVMAAHGVPRAGFGFAGDEPADVVLEYWTSDPDDPGGRFYLATLVEILEMDPVRGEYGDGEVFYSWPYLVDRDLDALTPAEEMDIYRLVAPEGRRDMAEYGGYTYYRVGIQADGTWSYFLAGD